MAALSKPSVSLNGRQGDDSVKLEGAKRIETIRFNFALGNLLWEAHEQLSAAYDQALRFRLAGAA